MVHVITPILASSLAPPVSGLDTAGSEALTASEGTDLFLDPESAAAVEMALAADTARVVRPRRWAPGGFVLGIWVNLQAAVEAVRFFRDMLREGSITTDGQTRGIRGEIRRLAAEDIDLLIQNADENENADRALEFLAKEGNNIALISWIQLSIRRYGSPTKDNLKVLKARLEEREDLVLQIAGKLAASFPHAVFALYDTWRAISAAAPYDLKSWKGRLHQTLLGVEASTLAGEGKYPPTVEHLEAVVQLALAGHRQAVGILLRWVENHYRPAALHFVRVALAFPVTLLAKALALAKDHRAIAERLALVGENYLQVVGERAAVDPRATLNLEGLARFNPAAGRLLRQMDPDVVLKWKGNPPLTARVLEITARNGNAGTYQALKHLAWHHRDREAMKALIRLWPRRAARSLGFGHPNTWRERTAGFLFRANTETMVLAAAMRSRPLSDFLTETKAGVSLKIALRVMAFGGHAEAREAWRQLKTLGYYGTVLQAVRDSKKRVRMVRLGVVDLRA